MTAKLNWKSPEAVAWCRDFTYTDYVNIICQRMMATPVSEEAYEQACQEYQAHMEKAFEDRTD